MISLSRQLQRWSMGHAALLLAATIGTVTSETVTPLLLAAVTTFAALLAGTLVKCSAAVRSLPNGITAGRLASILGLAWIATSTETSGYWLALAGLLLLLGDALDGWLARRRESTTSVGALLDEEVDAFFLLVLCVLAHRTGELGWWILIPGVLRYGFVLVRPLIDRNLSPTKLRTRRGRIVFVIMMVAMLTTFLPLPILYLPAAIGATGLLVVSFAADIYTLLRTPPELPVTLQEQVREERHDA